MPTTAGTIVNPTAVTGTNRTDVQVSKNWLNASYKVTGGTTGDVMVRDTGQTPGWGWLASVAAGQVFVSGGAGSLPAWSASPTLTSLTTTAGLTVGTTLLVSQNINFGGFAAGNVLLKPSGTNIQVRTGNDGADATFGASIFTASSALVVGTNPASVGAARFANGGPGTTYWRNATNTADVFGIYVDNANKVNVGDFSSVATILGSPTVTFASVGPHGIGGGTSPFSQLYVSGSFPERYGPYLNTTLAPIANVESVGLVVNPIFTEASSGTHPLLAALKVEIATVTAGAAAVANTASFYVNGPMTAAVTGKNYAAWIAGGLTRLDGGVQLTAVAFASVPASPAEGTMIGVTDSSTAVWGATITGGGANHVLAYYNGTNWTVVGK